MERMRATKSFRKSSRKPIIGYPSQGTPKLKRFIEEHAQSTQLSPLSKLINKSTTDQCELKKFNLHESPIAAKINSFENEKLILNQLSRRSSSLDGSFEAVDSGRRNTGHLCSKPVCKSNGSNKHKNVTVSRVERPSIQTGKYSTRNSIGPKKIGKFLQEYSQQSKNRSNVLNRPDQKNGLEDMICSNSNSRPNSKNGCPNNYFQNARLKGSVNTNRWLESSKIIHKKRTLMDYLKETKPRNISYGKSISVDAKAIAFLESRFSDSDISSSDEDLFGCARTKCWPHNKFDILEKERKRKDIKNIINVTTDPKEEIGKKEHSSSSMELDSIEQFSKEYDKTLNKNYVSESSSNSSCSGYSDDQRNYGKQKVDQWLKINTIQLNNGNVKKGTRRETSSEISFETKTTRSCRLKERNKKQSGPSLTKLYQNIAKPKSTVCRQSSDENPVTKYFSKSSISEISWTKQTNAKGSVDLNVNSITENKTQKNLYSSEGFCESMSLETPTLKTSDNRPPYPEKGVDRSKAESSQKSGFRKRNSIRDSEKFKEISSFIRSLHSQPQELSQKPERRKLTPSEERELSPDYYVMKMCGPESAALVKSILNSHESEEKGVNSLGICRNFDESFNNSSKSARNNSSNEISSSNNKYLRVEDSPSDPLSLGRSPAISYPGKCSPVSKVSAVTNPASAGCANGWVLENQAGNLLKRYDVSEDGHFDQLSHSENKRTISNTYSTPTFNENLTQTGKGYKNSQVIHAKEKLVSQTLESLHKLHENNSWHTQEHTDNINMLNKECRLGTNSDATDSSVKINQQIKHNQDLQHGSKAQKTFLLSKVFGTTIKANDSSNTKVSNTQVPTCTEDDKSLSQNTDDDPYLQKLLSQHTKNGLNKNLNDIMGLDHNRAYLIKKSQINAGQILENCETPKNGECHNKINYEQLKETQTDHFADNIPDTQMETQNVGKKLKKTYNITKDCILYGDNLLKSLVNDEGNVWQISRMKNALKRDNNEALLKYGRSYIKRYKKGDTKIFKMKRRVKKKDIGSYRPPESQIMDRFFKKINNDYKEASSSDAGDNGDDESVSTPVSYKTDDTKSEVLSTGSNSKLTDAQKLLRRGINKLSKDKSFLFSRFEDKVPQNFNDNEILENIERILNTVLDDFKEGKMPFFRVPKEGISNCFFSDGRYQMKEPPDVRTVAYKTNSSRQKFNLILFLLNKIKSLLETNTKLTKREIYYQLKTMISSQATTDRALKDISRMLNVGMWALKITAQKGLVYGNLKLVMADGETINCNVPGTLIPQDISKICEIQSTAYFILVVEKESIFHKLLEEDLPNKLTRPFILITGKGYPDLNTQLFLKTLWMIMSIPVFILVDADPHGIAIMLTYRFGSIANAHVSNHLAIPKARWLGVFPSEILRLTLSYENLNRREISMSHKLLQLECVRQNDNIKIELEKLLENGIKTGIEGLIKSDKYLSNCYLSRKFFTNNLI